MRAEIAIRVLRADSVKVAMESGRRRHDFTEFHPNSRRRRRLSLLDSGAGQRPLHTMVSNSVGKFGPTNGQVSYRDRGVRSLSRTEREERRKKGLCHKCGQLYGPSHKCPEGKLHVLLLGDDESDGHEGLHFQLTHMDPSHSDGEFSTKP
ncbi:hypothetical protein E3N88_45226 [Mikania micrantha]|uniref:Uncharacterized protein n=1 Tax=Mikania micrantha TaxID=192012 RepID=A0A5N6L9S5_9ASTR|nr:hypothetical protein E3N88_45226 [Mikania micrantha]